MSAGYKPQKGQERVSMRTVLALICAGPALSILVAAVAVVGRRLCLW
jgi:hypothetical protein